ncbi:MAG TPA: nuclear transport factor 2 family protein [Thermobifida alba]|nr:nuclear transport factor 2 family protein [Thermobifida alba]
MAAKNPTVIAFTFLWLVGVARVFVHSALETAASSGACPPVPGHRPRGFPAPPAGTPSQDVHLAAANHPKGDTLSDTDLLEELLRLERRGWDSLCAGTGADFYGSLMTDDGVMVLAHGFALDRAAVVASLDDAPPWSGYEISDARLVGTGPGGAALCYTGTAHRDGAASVFRALMSSVYVRRKDGWRLALYQQTPLPAPENG